MADLAQLEKDLDVAKQNRSKAEQLLTQAQRQGDKKAASKLQKIFDKYTREMLAIEREISEVGKKEKTIHAGKKIYGWFSKKSSDSDETSSSSSSSGGSFFSTSVNPIFIFILTLANYFYHWNVGFRIDAITLLIDLFTFFMFYFAFGKWSLALIPFALQTIIPGLLILVPGLVFMISSFISISLVLPWFIIFAVLYELKLNPDSTSTKLIAAACVLVTAIVLMPSFLTAVRSSDYVINQKLIGDAKETIGTVYRESIQGVVTQIKVSYCSLKNSKAKCEKQYVDVQKQFLERLKVDASLNTGFTMDVPYSLFVTEGQPIFENKITSYLVVENGLTKSATLTFGCGLENRGKGTPVPETLPIVNGVPSSQKSVACTIDTTRKGTPTFYFNVTAQSISSTGYTDILITSKSAKDAVLSKYPGISENQILTLSKEFGFAIKSKESLLNPRVGKNDLVQPIVYTGIVTTFNAPATLLFGVEKDTELDFALFLKNNGNGIISSITDIKIDLPDDMEFVGGSNCGISELHYKTDWRKLKKGVILPIKSCKVKMIGDRYPNTAEPRTLKITISYDYSITRTQMVTIA
ncbi:MAG: hypothetical protein AABW88_03470 [Nanoarchaeota archaeon]